MCGWIDSNCDFERDGPRSAAHLHREPVLINMISLSRLTPLFRCLIYSPLQLYNVKSRLKSYRHNDFQFLLGTQNVVYNDSVSNHRLREFDLAFWLSVNTKGSTFIECYNLIVLQFNLVYNSNLRYMVLPLHVSWNNNLKRH